MSVEQTGDLDEAALERIFAAAGVAATVEELAAVSRAIARAEAAAALLGKSQSFDDTAEWFYRLLDRAGGETAA